MAFYIERPQDKYGNIGYRVDRQPVVIEGEKDERGFITVTAPEGFIAKWPRVYYSYFIECEGPARLLTEDEREQIVAGVGYPE